MSYQEKRSYVQFIANLLGFIGYLIYVISTVEKEAISTIEFGKYTLLLLPVLVISQILTKIIFDILNRTDEKQEEPSFMDELDYRIELKSVRNFSFVFIAGFFITMLFMWLDFSMMTNLITILTSIFLAGCTLEFSYIYYYKKGA